MLQRCNSFGAYAVTRKICKTDVTQRLQQLWHSCGRTQGFTDLFCRFGFPGASIVVGVDSQGHINCAMSCQILNLLDVQTGFKKAGDVSMTQNMSRDMCIRQFSLNQFPHASVGGLCERLMIPHS